MNSDEPALVPQWLQKGGPPGSSGGHNSSSTSQFSLRDPKSRPKREAPVSNVRTPVTASREGAFGRTDREPVRRDRSSRDSWTASALGSTSASSYRSAAPASVRNTRQPPERQVSDNSRSNTELGREGFGPATGGRGGVFRTQSGPPNLRDREDFGFGSTNTSYHDNYRFQPVNGRGPVSRGTPEKPPFEKDFPSLAGRSNAHKPWLSGNAPPAEQPWTRLADAPDGGTLSPRGSSPGPPPSPRLAVNSNSQAFSSPGHAGGVPNGEGEAVSRPSMSKLIGGEAPAGQSRMANSLQQGVTQGVSHAPSHDKARLEELVIRQSKQLVPVVASSSARDKGKGKGPALAVPKLVPGGGPSSAAPLGARGKAGLDGSKRAEDSIAGPMMTGLGPSLRRLPSADARAAGTSASASQPEGTSDAGDSADSTVAGSFKQPAAKDVERQRSSFFQSLRRSSKTPTPNPNPTATPTSPPSPSAQQRVQALDVVSSHNQPAGAPHEDITAANATTQPAAPIAGQSLHSVQSTPDKSASTSPEKTDTPTPNQQQADSSADGSAEAIAVSQHHGNGDGPAKASELTNGHKAGQSWDAKDPQLKVPAEEEAFLRSLGWTEPGDDEDEGLTEEEIAAFKANTQHLCIKSFRPSAESFSGLNSSFLRQKATNHGQGATRAGQLADISSSDSESDF